MALNYETTNWENGKTVLKAEHLRKIEKGITDIISENDAIYKDEDTRKSNEKQRQEEHSRKMNEVSEVVSDIQKDYDSLQKIIIDENASANLQNQIDQTNSQLEQNMNKINEQFNTITGLTNKHLEIINDKNDNVGNLNIANFSGQDLGSNAPIGQIFHHYTDGIAYQIDNVGENNNILILKNASNPSRRPDKANDFVGSGIFIQCLEHSTEGSSKRIFSLGTKGEMYWFDGDNSTVFGNNKSNNGSSAFKFDVYNKHGKLIEVSNGYTTEFLINHNSINNQLELIAGLNASGGLKIQTINGPIELTSGNEQIIINGKPLVYNNGNYQSIQTIKNGTPQSRPTPIAVGDNYFDTHLGKPIWCKQISPSIIWVDATGVTV